MHQVRKVSRGLASIVDLAVPGKVGPKCSGWRSQGAGKELSDTLSIASRSRKARFATNPNNCWGVVEEQDDGTPTVSQQCAPPQYGPIFGIQSRSHIQ